MSSISAGTTSTTTLVHSGDTTGSLVFKTNDTGSGGTTAMTIDTSQRVSFTNPIQGGSITSGTAVASTSGTSIDFTGIPSWVKRITVMFNAVSTNGASNLQVQIGAGSVTSTGYVSSGWTTNTNNVNSTAGFLMTGTNAAAYAWSGIATICLLGSNGWSFASNTSYQGTSALSLGSGYVGLSGTLDRVRITTVNGTDTFDAGSINILYEG